MLALSLFVHSQRYLGGCTRSTRTKSLRTGREAKPLPRPFTSDAGTSWTLRAAMTPGFHSQLSDVSLTSWRRDWEHKIQLNEQQIFQDWEHKIQLNEQQNFQDWEHKTQMNEHQTFLDWEHKIQLNEHPTTKNTAQWTSNFLGVRIHKTAEWTSNFSGLRTQNTAE